LEQAIAGKIKELQDEIATLKGKKTEDDGAAPEAIEASIKMMLPYVKDNRSMKITKAQESGLITADVAKKLRAEHCSDEGLKLSLKNEDKTFDTLMATLEANGPVLSYKAKTQSQGGATVLSSTRKDGEKSGLMKAAEKLREEKAGK
jgi:hypothetical protein